MGREEKLKGFRQPNSPVGRRGRKGDMGGCLGVGRGLGAGGKRERQKRAEEGGN